MKLLYEFSWLGQYFADLRSSHYATFQTLCGGIFNTWSHDRKQSDNPLPLTRHQHAFVREKTNIRQHLPTHSHPEEPVKEPSSFTSAKNSYNPTGKPSRRIRNGNKLPRFEFLATTLHIDYETAWTACCYCSLRIFVTNANCKKSLPLSIPVGNLKGYLPVTVAQHKFRLPIYIHGD